MTRIIVAITGASGAIYGVRLLERLNELPVETHLIATRWSRVTIEHETDWSWAGVKALADVVLKERRRLVLAVRETPLHAIHLRNMLTLSELGVTIFPPTPAFYNRPATVDEIVDQTVLRILDQFGLELPSATRWQGLAPEDED